MKIRTTLLATLVAVTALTAPNAQAQVFNPKYLESAEGLRTDRCPQPLSKLNCALLEKDKHYFLVIIDDEGVQRMILQAPPAVLDDAPH